MDVPALRVDELVLRPWADTDVAAVVAVATDPDVRRWNGGAPAYGPDQARVFLDRRRRAAADGTGVAWAVTDGTDVLGTMQLAGLPGGEPEIGYTVLPVARGRAVARRALRAATDWAFADGARAVRWLSEVGNEPSWRAVHGAGFRYEGVRRSALDQHGRWADAWAASLLPGDGPQELPWGADPVLVDGEVTVRRFREADVAPWLAMRNEPDVIARGYGGPRRRPLDPDEAWRELMVEAVEQRMTGAGMELGVVSGDTLVGNVSFHRFGGGATLGWWTGSAGRGRGATGRAVRLLVGHLAAVGVERVEARIHHANVGSQKVAERAGLQRVGVLPRDAPWEDGFGDAYLYTRDLRG